MSPACYTSCHFILNPIGSAAKTFCKIICEIHLRIDPASLLCLMNRILRPQMPDQQRRGRIVIPPVPQYIFTAGIGIAIPAEMPAGIILTDIPAQITGTFRFVLLFVPENSSAVQDPFIDLIRHAPRQSPRTGHSSPSAQGRTVMPRAPAISIRRLPSRCRCHGLLPEPQGNSVYFFIEVNKTDMKTSV